MASIDVLLLKDSEQEEEIRRKTAPVSKDKITTYVEDLYLDLQRGDELIIQIKRDRVLLYIRRSGHGHPMLVRCMNNFGFGLKESLEDFIEAIKFINDGLEEDQKIAEYCYDAIQGDVSAIRQTLKWRVKDIQRKLNELELMAERKIAEEGHDTSHIPYSGISEALQYEFERNMKILSITNEQTFPKRMDCITVCLNR